MRFGGSLQHREHIVWHDPSPGVPATHPVLAFDGGTTTVGNDTGLKEQICRSRVSESFVVLLYRYGHPSFDEAVRLSCSE